MYNLLKNSCVSLLLIVASCNASTDKVNEDLSPDTLYTRGMRSLQTSSYNEAIKDFEVIEREHPASDYAAEAIIKKAYSFYLKGEYEKAIETVESFSAQYPAHTGAPYMCYLHAICLYEQITDVGRDQTLTQEAIEALAVVIERFPGSRYAKDAQLKSDLAFNHLAGKEMEIGRFYLKEKQYTSAINRFRKVIEQYSTSIFIPEALYRLVELYYSLGIEDQAKKYAAVLGYNHPDSTWYKKAYDLVRHNKSDNPSSLAREIMQKIW